MDLKNLFWKEMMNLDTESATEVLHPEPIPQGFAFERITRKQSLLDRCPEDLTEFYSLQVKT